MRFALLSSFVIVGVIEASAQTQAKPPAQQPGTATPRPAPTATTPAQPRRAPAPSRSGMAITVTDVKGATLSGVPVETLGPTERNASTDASGQLNLPGLLPGTYRLRFSSDGWILFEREVTVRAGQVSDVDVSLRPAPEPPPPPPSPAPAPAPAPVPVPSPVGPTGEPLTLDIVNMLDKEFLGRQPRRESLLSCSGNERTSMIQLNEPMPQRLYESADVVYYVLGGEGSVTLDDRNSKVTTNGFISVPRGTAHRFDCRGSRPLVLLAVLSGEPCERAR